MTFTERRKNKRVADALALSIQPEAAMGPDHCSTTTYVVRLSTNGMRLCCDTRLPTDTPVRVALHLQSQEVPVSVRAQVVHCAERRTATCSSQYDTRLIFTEMDSTTRTLLETHIDQVIRQTQVIKELPYRQIA
jgi:hypothetical protein